MQNWQASYVPKKNYLEYIIDCPPYMSESPTPDERKRKAGFDRYHNYLKTVPKLEVRLGQLIRLPVSPSSTGISRYDYKQKGVDILLTIDIVKMSLKNQMQTAVLIACDSDFVPAIKVVKDEGVIVKLCFYDKKGFWPHYSLKDVCDELIKIDQVFINKITAP